MCVHDCVYRQHTWLCMFFFPVFAYLCVCVCQTADSSDLGRPLSCWKHTAAHQIFTAPSNSGLHVVFLPLASGCWLTGCQRREENTSAPKSTLTVNTWNAAFTHNEQSHELYRVNALNSRPACVTGRRSENGNFFVAMQQIIRIMVTKIALDITIFLIHETSQNIEKHC